MAAIITLIASILIASAIGGIAFYAYTGGAINRGLTFSYFNEKVHWGDVTYDIDWSETLEHEDKLNIIFTPDKFISIVDGTWRFRAFKVRGVSEREWLMVYFQDLGSSRLYRREGTSGGFPGVNSLWGGRERGGEMLPATPE
jgi:hypothetical protein